MAIQNIDLSTLFSASSIYPSKGRASLSTDNLSTTSPSVKASYANYSKLIMSRNQVENSAFANSIKRFYTHSVVNPIIPTIIPDKRDNELISDDIWNYIFLKWKKYSRVPICESANDYDGDRIYNILVKAVSAIITDGDCFLLKNKNNKWTLLNGGALFQNFSVGTQTSWGDDSVVISGIRYDNRGKKLSYLLTIPNYDAPFKGNFNDDSYPMGAVIGSGGGYLEIPAKNVIHVIWDTDNNLNRGGLVLQSVLSVLDYLATFDNATLAQMSLNSQLGLILESNPNAAIPESPISDSFRGLNSDSQITDAKSNEVSDLIKSMRELDSYSALLRVPLNYKSTQIRMEKPDDVAEIRKQMVQMISAASGVPMHELTQDYGNANYNSARSAGLSFEKISKSIREVLGEKVLRPIYDDFLLNLITNDNYLQEMLGLNNYFDSDIAKKALDILKGVSFRFTPTRIVEAGKEITAIMSAVSQGKLSLQSALDYLGFENTTEELLQELAREQQLQKKLGIEILTTGGLPIDNKEKDKDVDGEMPNDKKET